MFELNKLYNMDCMEGMKEIPDKYFELAIVDPPYGGGCSQIGNVERERERTARRQRRI
jgi:site-specific DNA-methyltransferase (adenine-specific)